jgi:hypothetical protein
MSSGYNYSFGSNGFDASGGYSQTAASGTIQIGGGIFIMETFDLKIGKKHKRKPNFLFFEIFENN